jgi:hypothetical protein
VAKPVWSNALARDVTMDHLTHTQMAIIAIAGAVQVALAAVAIALIDADRPARPLAALRGQVIPARRTSAALAAWTDALVRGGRRTSRNIP